jgi:hypothetical protein
MRAHTFIELVLITGVMVAVFAMIMSSCTTGRSPAKQQHHITSTPVPTSPNIPNRAMPVDQIDLNRDGQLDTHEQQLLRTSPDHTSTLIAFASIMLLVVVVSVLCGVVSRRSHMRSNQVSGSTVPASEEPAAPEQLLREAKPERLRRDTGDKQFEL